MVRRELFQRDIKSAQKIQALHNKPMDHSEIGDLYKDAFQTFKAFDNLTVQNSGADQDEFPASIWQILNHLLIWQAYQINCFQGIVPEKHIDEVDTWVSERAPASEGVLQAAVMQFKQQLETFQTEMKHWPATGKELIRQLNIIRETALHLSFHLGEIVLIRRMKGSYPMPDQMKAFLQV